MISHLTLILFFVFSFAAQASTVCDKSLSSAYQIAISELAKGYLTAEKMKTEGNDEVPRRIFERELAKKRKELVASVGEEQFTKDFEEAAKVNGIQDRQESRTRRETRARKREEQKSLVAHWNFDKIVFESGRGATALALSANAELALLTADNLTRIVNLASGIEVCSVPAGFRAAFHPNGKTFLTADAARGEMSIWNTKDCSPVTSYNTHHGAAWFFSFSHDGSKIVSGTVWDPYVRIIDSMTGEELAISNDIHSQGIRSVQFSTDDRFIVSTDGAGKLVVWEISSRKTIQDFEQRDAVNYAEFTPDAKSVLMRTDPNTLMLWDVNSGQPIKTYPHSDAVLDTALSTDGKMFIAAFGNDLQATDIDSQVVSLFPQIHKTVIDKVRINAAANVAISVDLAGQLVLWKKAILEVGEE